VKSANQVAGSMAGIRVTDMFAATARPTSARTIKIPFFKRATPMITCDYAWSSQYMFAIDERANASGKDKETVSYAEKTSQPQHRGFQTTGTINTLSLRRITFFSAVIMLAHIETYLP
jgi:hypothetical protein